MNGRLNKLNRRHKSHRHEWGCYSKVSTSSPFFSDIHDSYSVLKLFTGFATAAFIAWKLIVTNATITASIPANAKIHQLIFILYAKFCNQLFITNHASGEAITNEMKMSLIKSFDKRKTILLTDAPSTLRTPISFVRCVVVNNESPSKPRHAMKMAKLANMPNTFPNNSSFLYCSLNFSSRK